ncbi:MAG: hypothetical protein K0U98_24610 [Deltaproteobacteria bacterium]|nr:hypothetical protein [Deltaproteobacteria bacterium]
MEASKFARNVVLWLLPVALVWILLTQFYNRFLTISAENLLHLTETPDITQLHPHAKDRHYITVSRGDFPPARSKVYSIRVTDIHYHLILLGALFLATPGVPLRKRFSNLGWAILITIFFDMILLFFWVKFAYATQLGSWSVANYGAFWRNFFGLGKHLLDLPFKLALPLALWATFYFPRLAASRR